MPPFIRLLRSAGLRQADPPRRARDPLRQGRHADDGRPPDHRRRRRRLSLPARPLDASTFAPLATLVLVGGLGAFDDYLNARTGEGIRARQKLLWQIVVAVVAAWQIQQTYAITAIAVPFVGAVRSTRRCTSPSPPSRSLPRPTA